MQHLKRPAFWLAGIILVLGTLLSLAGLLREDIYGGLSQSLTVQARGQDLVTVCLAVPALLAALIAAVRGSPRGELVLAGLTGYFLYTYASYAFLVEFNPFFFGYVAEFSCSLFAFVLLMAGLNRLAGQGGRIEAAAIPLRAGAALLLIVGAAVGLMWLAQLLPALTGGSSRVLEESGGRPIIQVLDLGVLVPAFAVAAVMAFRGRPAGLVWVFVLLVKGLTLGLAVVVMTLFMARAGIPDWGGTILFSLVSALILGALVWLFSALKSKPIAAEA
jgi:hypothetical protein